MPPPASWPHSNLTVVLGELSERRRDGAEVLDELDDSSQRCRGRSARESTLVGVGHSCTAFTLSSIMRTPSRPTMMTEELDLRLEEFALALLRVELLLAQNRRALAARAARAPPASCCR